MRGIDPDVLSALQMVFKAREAKRVGLVRKKHRKQLEEQITTQIELLSDEIEEVIPKDHPAFQLILLLAVEGKLSKAFEEPEFRSFLDEGFPTGW